MMNNLGSDSNIIIYGFPNSGKTTLNDKVKLISIFDTDDSPEVFQDGLLAVERFRVELIELMIKHSSNGRTFLTNLPSALNLSSTYEFFAFIPNLNSLKQNRHIETLGYKTVLGWYIHAVTDIKRYIQNNNDIRLFVLDKDRFISDIIHFNHVNDLIYNDYHMVSSKKVEILDELNYRASIEYFNLFLDN